MNPSERRQMLSIRVRAVRANVPLNAGAAALADAGGSRRSGGEKLAGSYSSYRLQIWRRFRPRVQRRTQRVCGGDTRGLWPQSTAHVALIFIHMLKGRSHVNSLYDLIGVTVYSS